MSVFLAMLALADASCASAAPTTGTAGVVAPIACASTPARARVDATVHGDDRVAVTAPEPSIGYLVPSARPDLTRILPGPPSPGSPRAIADRRSFERGRALVGSARWRQAQADVSSDLPRLFRDAIGFDIDLARMPALARLLTRYGADRSAAVDAAKRHWQARRPFLGTTAAICEPRTAALERSGDYPSGHTANGQAFALIMAELVPERATAILTRGRDYGDSRHVCGSHTVSAVEGGRLAAAAIVAAEHGSSEFRDDLRLAAAELTALRNTSR